MPTFEIVLRTASDREPVQRFSFRLEPGEEVVFGRSSDGDVAIPDPDRKVSSRHGRIVCDEQGGLHAYDLGSLNGTYYCGEPLDSEAGTSLADGDVLRVSDYELVLELRPEPDDRGPDDLHPADLDLEATISTVGVKGLGDRLADRILAIYGARVGDPPASRQDAMQAEIRATLDGLPPQEAAGVLDELAERISGLETSQPVTTPGPMAPRPNSLRRGPIVQPELPPAADTEPPSSCLGDPPEHTGAADHALRELAREFVPGASLSRAADIELFATLLRQLCGRTLDWLARGIKSRGVFAEEFGAEVTLVFQRSNNPLKAMSLAELGRYLLDWRGDTDAETRMYYLDGVLTDLAQHQVGVLAGVREAVASVITELSPDRIAVLAKKTKGWTKAGRAWRAYQQLHKELTEERSKLYNELISPSIQKGYLQQHGDGQEAEASQP